MAHINFSKANCKNCYKCLRSCPVKAIKFKNQQAQIVEERCIKCGHCLYNCPQNASFIQSDLYKVKQAIKLGKQVIASIDPSFLSYFPDMDEQKVIAAIKKLGFNEVEESSIAIEAMDDIYSQYIKKSSSRILISTCCPSANYLVEKYYPELIKYLIPLDSPMVAHGKILKKNYGSDAYTVFIGPCVSRKFEAGDFKNANIIDAVLSFDEIHRWISGSNIDIASIKEEMPYKNYASPAMGYHIGEGESVSLKQLISEKNMDIISVNGINHCMEIFEELKDGKVQDVFVDVSACRGNCIGGPNLARESRDFFSRRKKVTNYVKNRGIVHNDKMTLSFSRSFFDKGISSVYVKEEDIQRVMKLMGKFDMHDELNCGVCGYSTCRDKARAVCLGMAEIEMCLNFMRGKAENITNVIFKNSPNIIMIIDENLNIVEINPAAERAFSVTGENIKGKNVSVIIDSSDIIQVKYNKENILGKRVEYPQYNGIFVQNIVYLEKHSIILVTMDDIMEEERNKIELMNVRENTLNAAQDVIEKQMRVAHEIASLLGETTAETKVTLTKLKKFIQGN